MINFQLLDNTTLDANNQTAYTRLRFDIILKAESSVATPYLDTKGIPTIGIGFNLRDDNILKLVLNAFGIDTTSPSSTALATFKRMRWGRSPIDYMSAIKLNGDNPCLAAHG